MATAAKVPELTARQRGVLIAAANGRDYRETADLLGIAPDTVKIHRGHAIRALASANITQAVARAIILGLIDTQKIEVPL